MTPNSAGEWSQPELARNVIEIKQMLHDMRIEQRAQRAEFVHRDVYAADQRSYEEYKRQAANDMVDVQAEQARIRKELAQADEKIREDAREALADERRSRLDGQWKFATLAITGAGVVAAIVNATGLGA